MSINSLEPTFNNHVANGRLNEIKAASDIKNDTDDLTIATRNRKESSHGVAAHINRNIIDDKKMRAISVPVDSLDYFEQLLKDDNNEH